jgi:hypothetical protein
MARRRCRLSSLAGACRSVSHRRPPRPAGVCFRPSARLTGAWIVLAVWALAAVILAVTTVYRRDV